MSTDFNYGNKTVNAGGPVKPSGKDMPGDPRARVNTFADIANIPVPYVGLKITVKADETNNNKMTDYIVKSLKANSNGIANMAIDEVVRYVDYLGASSGGSVSQEDINTAVNNYLTEHPVQSGATAEQAAQIEANRVAIGDSNSGLIKEVNNIKNTELQNLNTAIQTLETIVGVDETVGDKTGLPSGDANIIASINRIDSKPSGTVTNEQISTAVNNYLTEHPVQSGATTEQAAQIQTNKNDIADIINNKLDGKTFKFLTQAEYDALSESEKNNETIEYHITDATENSHTHTNKEVLDKIGEDTDGSLLFNGNKITSNSTSGGITNVEYENLSPELQSLFIVIK